MNVQPNVDNAQVSTLSRQFPSVRELFWRYLLQHTYIHHEPKLETIIQRNRAARIANPNAALPSVGIIGAGMAGLYSAMILEDLGIDYHILEADKERIGGRVYTYRYPKEELVRDDVPYPYVELGAMRFPDIPIMDRLLGSEYWSLKSKLEKAGYPLTIIPYHLSDDNNLRYYNGKRIFASDSLENDPLYFSDTHNGGPGTAVPDKYCNTPYTEFLYPEYDKFADKMAENFNEGFNDLLEADNNSTRAYLYKRLFEQSAINFFETMETGTGLYDMAFTETIMDYFDFSGSTWSAIDGGTDKIVDALVKCLKADSIEQGKFVTKITQNVVDSNVTGLNVHIQGETTPRTYDHVISTGTLASLRKMNLNDLNLSHNKRLAIRSCNYDHSVKISLSFTARWWEDSVFMKGKPIKGGTSSTDLPVRNIVYPSYGVDTAGSAGILIVSYTWAQDASRIGSLVGDAEEEKQLIDLCMQNLAEVHGVDLKTLTDMLIGFKCWDWYSDTWANGAFALYSPAQFTQLFPSLTKPTQDGRFHLAGEATSVHHAWIVGSLNSAYRAVDHVLMVEGLEDYRAKLRENWGTIDECEDPYYSYADVEVGGYADPNKKDAKVSTKKLKVEHTKDVVPKLLQAALLKKPKHPTTAACIGGLSR